MSRLTGLLLPLLFSLLLSLSACTGRGGHPAQHNARAVFEKIWRANAHLFKDRDKPKLRVSRTKDHSIAGSTKRNSIKIHEWVCRQSDAWCAHVIAHELAHILNRIYKTPDRRFVISDCRVPVYELLADVMGREMAVRAGFAAHLGAYEEQCGIRDFISSDAIEPWTN
ncbi:MAG: hypothetical protein ISN29_06435 [Gammaproteobacteria bacterium AqS3]|nr:hypothetical protein [Gammaproteobacteria bacterium AqS3]